MTVHTIRVAKDLRALEKRLRRFFDPFREDKRELCHFIDAVSEWREVFIFGGCVRDIALFGARSFDSDIDIVYDGTPTELSSALKGYSTIKNRYGGYKVSLGFWELDIWPIAETWAFKEGLVSFLGVESLLDTTITNWDSALFSWSKKRVVCLENYLTDLDKGYLDIVLRENPNRVGALIKILRTIILKNTVWLSPNICHYIDEGLNEVGWEKIEKEEGRSYNEVYINERLISYIKQVVESNKDSIVDAQIGEFYKTERLV
ncbi:hypothetical protein [Vreelandella utahensis]|uniref:hypothetical protein n=1 Tax=Vreelandella halophila TaxID=86177 RepID=UPI00117A8F23|nr:hypothetical protein [Halomonas utahensis]